jgi:hypothetical protein
MACRHQPNKNQSGYQNDPFYRDAIFRYLGFLAVACTIASWHAGPVTILVWLAVAYALTRGGSSQNRKPSTGKSTQSKRRRP